MSRKIMFVDDSKTIREMLGFTLQGAGYETLQAEDGVDALNVIGDTKVDLVITDLNMPNMDGITLIKKLREHPVHRATPILVLTTESQDEKKMEGKQAGATGWIVKPFTPDKLLATIDRVLV